MFCFGDRALGWPKYSKVMAGALEGDTFIGNKAQENRGLLRLRYPIEHGIIQNWDDMQKIWSSVLQNELKTSLEDHPVLLTEAPLNPKRHRDKCAQIFFETYSCPALYMSIQAVLALYASGRTTGVVLDSGDGVSHSVPVYEGFSLPNAIKRIDVAGRDVTEQLQLLLRKNGYLLQTSAEKEIVRLIKEKTCYVSIDPQKDEKDWYSSSFGFETSQTTNKNVELYKLPDGKTIEIGAEKFRSAEILFQPEIIGSEFPGIHEMVFDSIGKVDLDLRNSLYQSVVLSGGTTLLKGFGDRLINELKVMTPKGTKIKIFAPPERKYSTWIGGSILAGLSTFKKVSYFLVKCLMLLVY
ncbi:Actin-1 [Wickerhamomyces ciferrii]|uniref:Actin-1 n=1 Tax=Wickerhamomyces ciferrii (strain ATCC 14091 / BCRC 22168 / CBS 111 / JCM 3599 / NBRC 0793 / NRRL Y-1031 F-60-10) TaxID=1206466 RepID=K0KMY7_WICCF|nr:Actin-1 [Wickerhamomyces ciferrii]CCH43577.1 Actin-1 [Wickerhamomyces ciferrii]